MKSSYRVAIFNTMISRTELYNNKYNKFILAVGYAYSE